MKITVHFENQTDKTRTLVMFSKNKEPILDTIILGVVRLRDGQHGTLSMDTSPNNAVLATLHESDCGKYSTLESSEVSVPGDSWIVNDCDGKQELEPAPEKATKDKKKELDSNIDVDPEPLLFTNNSHENACIGLAFGDQTAIIQRRLVPNGIASLQIPCTFTLALMEDALPGDVVYPSLVVQPNSFTMEVDSDYTAIAKQDGEVLELMVKLNPPTPAAP